MIHMHFWRFFEPLRQRGRFFVGIGDALPSRREGWFYFVMLVTVANMTKIMFPEATCLPVTSKSWAFDGGG